MQMTTAAVMPAAGASVPPALSQLMRRTLDIVKSQYYFENLYRILFGVAHSDPSAITILGFREVDSDNDGQILLQRRISEDMLNETLANAVRIYARPSWMLFIQYGFNSLKAASALERAYTDLGLANTDSVRFWRANIENCS